MPDLQQAKISLTPPLVEFLSHYETYGFRDKSEMVRNALQRLSNCQEITSRSGRSPTEPNHQLIS